MISRSDEGRRHGGGLTKVQLRPEPLTRGLGWFSIALGMAELLAPRTVARAVGTDSAGIVRLYGLRELACGIGILAFRDPTPFFWARVGGDVIDLATLAATSSKVSPREQSRVMRVAVNMMAITALDLFAAQRHSVGRASREARRASIHDYGSRTGFPRTPTEMRGAALADFNVPRDMRTPDALQPYTRASEGEE